MQGKIYPTCFIVLPTQKVDIILGMNWMEEQGVLLDTLSQTVHINSALHGPVTVYLRNCTSLAQTLNQVEGKNVADETIQTVIRYMNTQYHYQALQQRHMDQVMDLAQTF